MKHAGVSIAAAALAMTAGCEVKREGGADGSPSEPTPTANGTVSLDDAAVRPSSIIRPEVTPTPADVPPEPLAATIPFADGGYDLGPEARRLLRELRQSEQVAEDWPIVLRGHTDSEGSDQGNLFASRKRAEAVAGWLAENGIDADRIEVIALGEQRPIAPNAHLDGTPDEDGRRANRRVEVWIGPPGSQPGEAASDDDEKRAGTSEGT